MGLYAPYNGPYTGPALSGYDPITGQSFTGVSTPTGPSGGTPTRPYGTAPTQTDINNALQFFAGGQGTSQTSGYYGDSPLAGAGGTGSVPETSSLLNSVAPSTTAAGTMPASDPSSSGFLGQLFSSATGYFARGGLFIVGAILLLGAMLIFARNAET